MRLLITAGSLLAALMFVPLLVTDGVAQETEAEYVGADSCKKCHFKEHRYWKKTGKYDAVASLKATAEADDAELFARKKAAGLDPAKDYSTDKTCLPCHTTGYGKKGGYPESGEGDAAEAMARVGCESCHGPGSLYVEHKTKEMAANKDAKFTFEGMAKLGLIKPDADNCATCHNDKNPAQPADPFDFDDAKTKVHSKQKK
jgi:hypothetical protein